MITASKELLDKLVSDSKTVRGIAVLSVVSELQDQLTLLLLSKQKLDKFKSDYEALADGLRILGRAARDAFAVVKGEAVSTVKLPFTLDGVMHHVAVTCSDMPQVDQKAVESVREVLGERFNDLFVRHEKRSLKPGGEDIVMGLLASHGLSGEQLALAAERIFESDSVYFLSAGFKEQLKSLPLETRLSVENVVKLPQPSIRFS